MTGEGEIREAVKNPLPASKGVNGIAHGILDKHELVADGTGAVYRYENGPWRRLSDIALMRLARDADSGGTTGHRRREIVDYMRTAAYEADLTWGRVADFEVGCVNGIVDVRSGAVGPHKPEPTRWTALER